MDAASGEKGELPEWVQKDVEKFEKLGVMVKKHSLLDDDWETNKREILDSDILFFEGGSTPKLLQTIKGTQLMKMVWDGLMDNKVWFGVSAGGCVLSPECYSSCEKWFMKVPGERPVEGLVSNGNFCFVPHFRSKYFELNTEENVKYIREKLNGRCVLLGTDGCVVTGALEDGNFIPDSEMHDTILLSE